MLDYQQQEKWEFIPSAWQSPIDIETKQVEQKNINQTPLVFLTDYVFESVISKGNNLQFNGRGRMKLKGNEFEFQQLHFHIPAEHILDGKVYPMEWHFVHQNNIGQPLVVALFVELGQDNSILQPFYEKDNLRDGEKQAFEYRLPMNKLITENKQNAYNYLGSLTTPPLSRGVEWWVLQQPLVVSIMQLKALQESFNGNARETQRKSGRKIILYRSEF
ncbi:carbonic anhydrase [Liquorilactobacillus sucicola DSM 21376 = JCM 15457]|uniref:carbonic anhydrase n=1 Tax=Liquorilactobacillus sucicola DSM 21376 = JCM 15457 TaxID=1423806 RepID=A0A023CZ55_9LACO|nr:carbonic anhydrase family protein [Liquorilactobacillus sucicola]KRN07589.1 carbonate dehydratase [Liquorilactobacillus sucicola DSM 21376 = JCM 15457]GAJ26780.1 carbonic anhydrase [Liquorilactobacillus sucicola DSM 21376 = JCM 15457]